MINTDSISVIISNFNGAKYLPRLIETLKAQQEVKLELIVVDRNSVDESDAILAIHPDIKVIKHPPETGLVCGYAVGADLATHDLLFFCNEDMWYEPDCLKILCDQIDLPNRVSAVMPVQWTYDGTGIVNAGAWFTKRPWYPSNPYPFRTSIWHLVDRTCTVSGINAGACLIHRQAYDELGGWDRSFFLDYEDMDLSLRLWQHDWKCLVVPSAKVYHAVGASNNKSLKGGKFKVSRKRYIEGSSNVFAIAFKTFTGPALFLPFAGLADRFIRNLIRLRWKSAWWDMLVITKTLTRIGKLIAFRKQNKPWNQRRPGQDFFKEPTFDFATVICHEAILHAPH